MSSNDRFVISAAYHYLKGFAVAMYPDYEFADHNRLIIDKLEAVERGEIKKLMISIAPRSGKSLLSSELFPAWYLGRDPSRNIICSSYSQDIVEDFGRKVRNLMKGQLYKAIFQNTRMSVGDSASVKKLSLHGGGGYYAVSAGSALTGRGADCLTGDTLVMTEDGEFSIEYLYRTGYNGNVLSFNHKNNYYAKAKIVAYRKIKNRETWTIRFLSGHSIRSTGDHKIFVKGKGYIEARLLKAGDRVIAFDENEVQKVPQSVFQKQIRCQKINKEESQRPLLWATMFSSGSCDKKSSQMCCVWTFNSEEDFKVLFTGMQKYCYSTSKADTMHLSLLSNYIFYKQIESQILQRPVLFFISQQANAQREQSKIQTRERTICVVAENKAFNQRKGRLQMRDMRCEPKIISTSYRSQPTQQHSNKFDNNVSPLSHNTSQINMHTVSSVERNSGEKHDVYDLQIEEYNNFFANGILVHNCLIIDDPIKNRADANSPTIRNRIIDWYKSTAYTRLSPSGSVCIISTRWHEDDLCGHLLNTENDWEVINVPAINEQGESYWPDRWPLERLEEIKKTIGTFEWSALYMQSPKNIDSGMFQRSWFEIVDAAPRKATKVRAWDLAASVPKNGSDPDYTVGLLVSKDKDNIFYIEHMVRMRGSSLSVQKTIKQTADIDPKGTIIGFEQDPGQAGKAMLEYLIRELAGYRIKYIKPTKDKVSRASPASAQAEAGNIKIVKGSWNKDLLEELEYFPMAKHDDITDSLSLSISILTQKTLNYEALLRD